VGIKFRIRWTYDKSFILFLISAGLSAYGLYGLDLTGGLISDGKQAAALMTFMDHRLRSADEPVEPWHNEVRWSRRAWRTIAFTADSGERVVSQPMFSLDNIRRRGFIKSKGVPKDEHGFVLYDPADPHRWQFNDVYSLWVLPISAVAVGMTGFLILGLILWHASHRVQHRVTVQMPAIGDVEKTEWDSTESTFGAAIERL